MSKISLSQTEESMKGGNPPALRDSFFSILGRKFALKIAQMKPLIFISLLLVFLGHSNVVNGEQIALRQRPKEALLSRSLPNDGSIFDPTDEETFFIAGGEVELNPVRASCDWFLTSSIFNARRSE